MATKTKQSNRDKIIDAALRLIPGHGWSSLSMQDISKEAGLDLAEIHDEFKCKSAILRSYGDRLDKRVLSVAESPEQHASPREALFDLMIERYEIMNEDRDALVTLIKELPLDPCLTFCLMLHGKQSMGWILEAAGICTQGIRGRIKIKGLYAIHLFVLRKWMDDESPDLSATMACLDRALNRAEQIANSFGLGGAEKTQDNTAPA